MGNYILQNNNKKTCLQVCEYYSGLVYTMNKHCPLSFAFKNVNTGGLCYNETRKNVYIHIIYSINMN